MERRKFANQEQVTKTDIYLSALSTGIITAGAVIGGSRALSHHHTAGKIGYGAYAVVMGAAAAIHGARTATQINQYNRQKANGVRHG